MKFSLYSKKNQLDEMQEQTLRKIESHGFWLLWGSLLAAWIVQTVFGAADKAAGEWVVFMIGCIYTVVACLRNGLWDRHLSDTAPANAVYSLVAAVAVTPVSYTHLDVYKRQGWRHGHEAPHPCAGRARRRS